MKSFLIMLKHELDGDMGVVIGKSVILKRHNHLKRKGTLIELCNLDVGRGKGLCPDDLRYLALHG